MGPPVQYSQTSDGVCIAFWTVGEGPPFVHMPNTPWSHGLGAWLVPEMARWFDRLTAKTSVVRYDNCGSGLSDRDVTDRSLEAIVRDLEAVSTAWR